MMPCVSAVRMMACDELVIFVWPCAQHDRNPNPPFAFSAAEPDDDGGFLVFPCGIETRVPRGFIRDATGRG